MARQCLEDSCPHRATHGPLDSERPWACYFHSPKNWYEIEVLTPVEDARASVTADDDMTAHDFLQGDDQ